MQEKRSQRFSINKSDSGSKWFTVFLFVAAGMLAALIFLFVASLSGCEKEKYEGCWNCKTVNVYKNRELKVTGEYPMCDMSEAAIRFFEEINSSEDSVSVQTTKCERK